uniref:Uncharacterized protein n=1 Tax=Panagrolaimus superbus TaxID=310955 RepID=A0A914Y6N9_9BILA
MSESFVGQYPNGVFDTVVIFSRQAVPEAVETPAVKDERHPLEYNAMYSRKVVERIAAALASKYCKRECVRCHEIR